MSFSLPVATDWKMAGSYVATSLRAPEAVHLDAVSAGYLKRSSQVVTSLEDKASPYYGQDLQGYVDPWLQVGSISSSPSVARLGKLQAAALAIAGVLTVSAPAEALPYTLAFPSIEQVIHKGASTGYGEYQWQGSNAVALAFAVKKIRGYRLVEEGWAGVGSVKPGTKTLVEAERFIKRIYSGPLVSGAMISLSSDGQVNFYWNNGRVLLDFGVNTDGRQSYYARLANGEEIIEDDLPVGTELAAELHNLILA